MIRLHINIDHVATIRNARGTVYPDPVAAAAICELAGADGITAHLREDRRHIKDDDIARLRTSLTTMLNLEMAATDEMRGIAERVEPALARSSFTRGSIAISEAKHAPTSSSA